MQKHGEAISVTDEESGLIWDCTNMITPEKEGIDEEDMLKMRKVMRVIN